MMRRSPAAERNKVAIGEALGRFIGRVGGRKRMLEIASGCGTHVMHLSALFGAVEFQPSDVDDDSLASVRARLSAEPRPNVAEPLKIDVRRPCAEWRLPHPAYDFVFNANMVHVAAPECAEMLFANAADVLTPSAGLLFLYGPFAAAGVLEPESNRNFDAALRLNNADWGVRDIAWLEEEAAKCDMVLEDVVDMPANNKIVVWRRN